MIFIKALFSCVLLSFLSLCQVSSTEEIIDKETKLHLYTAGTSRDISFSVQKYDEDGKRFVSEFTNLVANDTEKKWSVCTSQLEPSHEVRKTWSITARENSLLLTYLANRGSGLESDFLNAKLRIEKTSSVSEFLDEILKLPKFASTDSEDPIVKQPWYNKKVVITTAVCLSAALLFYLSKDHITHFFTILK